jgi:hypothetical protein
MVWGTGWQSVGGMKLVTMVANASAAQRMEEALRRKAAMRRTNSIGPLSHAEAAEYLHISIRQLYRLRKKGLIGDCRRFGKEGTVNRSDVLKLASANERG